MGKLHKYGIIEVVQALKLRRFRENAKSYSKLKLSGLRRKLAFVDKILYH